MVWDSASAFQETRAGMERGPDTDSDLMNGTGIVHSMNIASM